MKLKQLSDFPQQVQSIIRNLDQADVLISTLLIDSNRDQDAMAFSIPYQDVIVFLEMIHTSLAKSLDIISECQ